MANERIEITDTPQTAIAKMCDGNPGALRVLCDVFKRTPEIDPDRVLGGFGSLLSFDTLGIYGARVWMLYKDVCDEDLVRTLGVLRANQLGIVPNAVLKDAIENRGEGLDVEAALRAVRERLPRFGGVFASEPQA